MKPDPVLDYESLSAGPRTYSYLTVADWWTCAAFVSLNLTSFLGRLGIIPTLMFAYFGCRCAYRQLKSHPELRAKVKSRIFLNLLLVCLAALLGSLVL
jgi:hypothetical protein